jgi:hypothetical protein
MVSVGACVVLEQELDELLLLYGCCLLQWLSGRLMLGL